MGAGVKPELDPLDALIRARLAAHQPQAAPQAPGGLDALIAQRLAAHQQEGEQAPFLRRVADNVTGAVSQAVQHPLDTAESLIGAPIKSAYDAVMSPSVGEDRPDPRMGKGGNSAGLPLNRGQYDAAHGAVTGKQRLAAGAQTLANIAAPGIAKGVGGLAGRAGAGKLLSGLLGTTAVGGTTGAAYSPDDPLAGAATGSILAAALHGTGSAASHLTSSALDRAPFLRPASRPAPQLDVAPEVEFDAPPVVTPEMRRAAAERMRPLIEARAKQAAGDAADAPVKPPVEIPASKYTDKAVGDPENRAILERPGFIRQQPSMFTARSGVGGVRQTGPFIMKGEQPQGAINFKNQPTQGGVQQTGPFAGGPRAGQLGDDQSAMLQRLGVNVAKPAEARGIPAEIPSSAAGAEAVTRLGAGRTVEPGQRGMGSPGYVHIGAIDFGDPTQSPTLGAAKKIAGAIPRPSSLEERGLDQLLRKAQDAGLSAADLQARHAANVKAGITTQTPMELIGQPAQRLARTARSASTKAGAQIDQALSAREAGAPDRAIDDLLETTGLQKRSNGFQTAKQLYAARKAASDEAYPKVFAAHPEGIADPELDKLLKTDAAQRAAKRGARIASNNGEEMGTATVNVPKTFKGAKGLPDATINVPTTIDAPTLKFLHYVKLGLDDMSDGKVDLGGEDGGAGSTEINSVRGVKRRLLDFMDRTAPDYADVRKVHADNSALMRANQLGRNLFKMDPAEVADQLEQMESQHEREVFRRAGVDAAAQKVADGPPDASQGVNKNVPAGRKYDPTDVARMKLLFPDEQGFQAFQQRVKALAEQGQSKRFVAGGSQTTDKAADLADLAGVTLLSHGIPTPRGLLKLIGAVQAKTSASRVADAVTPKLLAGADANPDVLAAVLKQLEAREQALRGTAAKRHGLLHAAGVGAGAATQSKPNP